MNSPNDPPAFRLTPTPLAADRLDAELRFRLAEVVALVSLTPDAPATMHFSVNDGRKRFVLHVGGDTTAEDILTPCECAVFDAIAGVSPGRLTSTAVMDALAGRNMLFGEATIKRALVHLVKMGRIRSSRKTPRGYSLVVPDGAA